jgi:hypothetical protein
LTPGPFSSLPGLGAGTFAALVALHLGWNLKYLFILDSDKAGNSERERYVRDYGMPAARVATIGELVGGVSEIEDLVDAHAQTVISSELGVSTTPTKSNSKILSRALSK